MTATLQQILETDAPIPTWFGVGGRADTLARPHNVDELRDLLRMFAGQPIRVLGDGANLLVDDGGVDGLVISLERFKEIDYDDAGIDDAPDRPRPITVHAQAGVRLPKLITQTIRRGVGGLEVLAGIPASVGGAAFMNAGGAFGQIADAIECVHAVTRLGDELSIPHDQICFDYRHSGLGWLVITGVDFHLTLLPEGRRPALRQRMKDIMAFKKGSQPLAADSAGCVFKNPSVSDTRVSAGMLIDQAGCKGLRVGGAEVSDVHANFFLAREQCTASDLMSTVQERVREKLGVELQPEVVLWRRGDHV